MNQRKLGQTSSLRIGIGKKMVERIFQYFGLTLFFLMLIAPFEYYEVKISVITLLVVISIATIARQKKINLSPAVMTWFMSFIGFGLFFSLWALIFPGNNISYVFRSMPVNILWPVLYCLVTPYIRSEEMIKMLHKTMILGAFYISIYLILAALSYIGLLPIQPDFFSAVKPVVGKYDASIQLFLPSTTSLLFLIPFLMAYLLMQIYKFHNIKGIYVIVALILGVAAIIITARRALLLNLIISPPLIFFFLHFARVKLDKKVKRMLVALFLGFLIIGTLGCIILIKYEILNLDTFIELFVNGFDFSKNSQDEGSIARAEQSIGLVQSWLDYPILGSGLGSASQYVNRSESTPWVYELSYLTLLFQTGIVGVLIYFSLFFWIFYKGVVLIRRNGQAIFLIPSLVGCLCFLIGNASNPYFVAFDHMWAIFLPVGFINFCSYKLK